MAVPQSTVASQPALQCVSTFTTPSPCPALRAATACSSARPCWPMAWLTCTSSSARASASSHAVCARCASGVMRRRASMRSSAHARFTAVGRDCRSSCAVLSSATSLASRPACSARPYAATAPMSGAPRTHISRMATKTSRGVARGRISSWCGSTRWSITSTARRPGKARTGRKAWPPTIMRGPSCSGIRTSACSRRHSNPGFQAGAFSTRPATTCSFFTSAGSRASGAVISA